MKLSENSAGRFIIATIASLFILVLLPEMALRVPAVVHLMGIGSINSGNAHLDVKAVDIENFQRATGPIDCVIIGASDAMAAIDPAQVESYHCYNFALGALHSSEAITLLDILLNKYDVKLLVIGASPYFFLPGEDSEYLLTDEWLCCYNSAFDFEGMLLHHSASYQYYQLGMISLLQPRYYWQRQGFVAQLNANGYKPRFGSLASSDPQLKYMITRVALRNRQIARTIEADTYPNMALIDYLTNVHAKGTHVSLVMLHPRPEFFVKVPETQNDYDFFMANVLPLLESRGITFLNPHADLTFSDDDWYDATHMNDQGATALSVWLNTQLANLPNN